MFENEWYESPTRAWSQVVSQKREAFKQQIRARQIDSYKNSIRQKFNLIINYADPVASVAHIKSAIAKQQHQITYVIHVVTGLMDNYYMSAQLARQKAIETILLRILDINPTNQDNQPTHTYSHLIATWVQLVQATTKNWPQLWKDLYKESITIFWAIFCQYFNDYQICQQIHKLLVFCSTRLSIIGSPNDEDLLFLVSQPQISAPILLSIGEQLTVKIEQTINNNSIMEKWSHYLDESDEHCNAYVFLLSRVGFVSRTVLDRLYQKLCQNQVQEKQLAVKILYEQMYFSEQDIEKLESGEHEWGEYVRVISENDD